MPEKLRIVNVGDTDLNADWIKTEETRRQEALIHEQIATEIRKREEPIEGENSK